MTFAMLWEIRAEISFKSIVYKVFFVKTDNLFNLYLTKVTP